MKEQKVVLEHLDNMAFKTEVDGHEFIFDAEKQFGGEDRGPRPKPFVLVALLGCTGMDVVSLFKKMRVEYDDFKVEAISTMTEEHPKYYDNIELVYNIWGKNVDKAKVEKAVNLSTERYCGVHFMLSKSSTLKNRIVYHN